MPRPRTRQNIYTDLAIELHDILQEERRQVKEEYELSGIKVSVSNIQDEIEVTTVDVTTEEGAREMGKPMGRYITVESKALRENDPDTHELITKELAAKLGELHQLKPDGQVLIVGLGNWHVTPDALGPKVIDKVLVTRHIPKEALPEGLEGIRFTSAIAPGVMGMTGVETAEIVKGVVDRTKPDLIIAIDALASRSTNRINSTIQVSNTGVAPGTGMGNKRLQINEATMGVPVIAIGVPTVVDAATLINDAMDKVAADMASYVEEGSAFYEMLQDLGNENRYPVIKDILDPYEGNMFVTPKEVDAVVERLSGVIANSINMALHPGITTEDMNRYLY